MSNASRVKLRDLADMVKPAAGLIAEQQDNGDLNQTPSRLRFTAASRLGESNARQVAAIYESSFSAAEREPINQLLSDIVTKRRACYLGKAGNLVVAFAVCLPLTHGIEFLEYFAVERHHRNQRIGTRLFRHMVTDIASRFRRGVIFEVEDPAMGTRTEAATRWRESVLTRNSGQRWWLAPPFTRRPQAAAILLCTTCSCGWQSLSGRKYLTDQNSGDAF